MKLYAFETPEIEKHKGYLKIGETKYDVERRVKKIGHELNIRNEVVWTDTIHTKRTRIDRRIHEHLAQYGFHVQKFEETGYDTEWVQCTVDDLKEAFNIVKRQIHDEEMQREAIGNQFYLEVRNWYYWATGAESNPTDEAALRIVIRLLFCHFLQEKELVPKELFDEDFIRELLKEDEEYSYYKSVLRNLFFYCLNTPVEDRRNIKLEHEKLIRYPQPIKELFKKIPFLNGGLFNKHDGDDIPLNNDYFFSEKRTRPLPKLNGNYEVRGIVRILSRYKYKSEIDDLSGQEYVETIDPEFIGKVFESLLACIETDSDESRRKITGSY